MINTYIQQRITKLRETKKDVSERKLSELLGFNPTYLTQILNGSALPSFEALETICKFFNITLSDFFDECYEKHSSVEYLAIKLREITDDGDLADLLKMVDALDKDAIKALLRVFRNYGENRK